MKATPPEFQEFMKAMAGKISRKIRWKLKKKLNIDCPSVKPVYSRINNLY